MRAAFEKKLTALLHEGLALTKQGAMPNAGVVGAFVGAAIAATLADGREPREVFEVLTDALRILHGPEQGQAMAFATQMSILIEEWLEKDSDPDRVILSVLGTMVGIMITAERDPLELMPMMAESIRIVLTPGPN